MFFTPSFVTLPLSAPMGGKEIAVVMAVFCEAYNASDFDKS